MKINESTDILLVPYDRRHVPTYHDWMEDEALRAATASDRLTLDEEYENQVSWRAASDKLTFILCRREGGDDDEAPIVAGVDDSPDRMVGDINFFLQPEEEDDKDDDDDADSRGTPAPAPTAVAYTGEIDVMLARPADRGRGLGRAAVTALLRYLLQPANRAAILAEAAAAAAGAASGNEAVAPPPAVLHHFMVKIQATNTASIRLFTGLGFQQRGPVNYFGEVELVRQRLDDGCDGDGVAGLPVVKGYAEREYRRAD